ncbi:argininosuccinate lyase [Mollicutes bacterium LVI A0039]|nr:argininosuccinate lyase [Mollicutes bacterium LVI A0039]
MSKLWNGRFGSDTDKNTDLYNASITFDIKLLPYDIKASIAHAKGLNQAKILTDIELAEIISGLNDINSEYELNQIEYSIADEDVHMLIERLLIEKIGETGKKVHTARSRNDQVAIATRLYTIDQLQIIETKLTAWVNTLDELSQKHKADIMAGYTHLQAAQPITLGFWFDAYKQMFTRDLKKVANCIELMSESPLGSAALAGSSYDIDRNYTASLLGLTPTQNSMDSVADRDYIIDSLYITSMISIHLSKMAEEIIIFNSQVYNYITLDDKYSTGSSIMPQKKNPDIAELARGKSARMIGNLMQMLTLIKGTPLAYNKDFQEDKEHLFDSIETIKLTLDVFSPMVTTATFNLKKMEQDCELGYINATDLADYLVLKGIPFRESHHIVGSLVKYAESNSIKLTDIDLDTFKQHSELIEADIYDFISVQACLARRTTLGAPGWFMNK